MLYATIDCSKKKHLFETTLIEEFLGELKIVVPKSKNDIYINSIKRVIRKTKKYNIQNFVLNNELNKNLGVRSFFEENKKYIVTGERLR